MSDTAVYDVSRELCVLLVGSRLRVCCSSTRLAIVKLNCWCPLCWYKHSVYMSVCLSVRLSVSVSQCSLNRSSRAVLCLTRDKPCTDFSNAVTRTVQGHFTES